MRLAANIIIGIFATINAAILAAFARALITDHRDTIARRAARP